MNKQSNPNVTLRRRASRREVLIGAAGVATVAIQPAATLHAQSQPTSSRTQQRTSATHVTTKDGVQIYFKDWGDPAAQPIVFHHGWPLSSDDWDT